MIENKYKVLINNVPMARDMDIRTATILVRALFDEYYNDYTMIVSIKPEDRTDCAECCPV